MNLDLGIDVLIQEKLASPLLDQFFVTITKLGDGALWVVLVILLLLFKKTRFMGFGMLLALLIGFLSFETIKFLVGRVRPYVAYGFDILIKAPRGSSFPSGHTTMSFSFATSFFLLARREWERILRWFVLILAVLISFSRLYLFVHYPSDVLVGLLLGILSGYLGVKIARTLLERDRLGFLRLSEEEVNLYTSNTFKKY